MEFVVVTFVSRRRVFMDDQPSGNTGDKLTVQAGHHDFDLGTPVDYSPKRQTVNVTGTTATSPLLVTFIQLPVAAEAVDEGEMLPVPGPPPAAVAPSLSAPEAAAVAPRPGARKRKARKAAPKRAAKRARGKARTRRASTKKAASRTAKKTASTKRRAVTRTSRKRGSKHSKKTSRKK